MISMKYRVRIKKRYVLKRLTPFMLLGLILGVTALYLNNHFPYSQKDTSEAQYYRAELSNIGGKYSLVTHYRRNSYRIYQKYLVQVVLPGHGTVIAGSEIPFSSKQNVCIKVTRNSYRRNRRYYKVVDNQNCPYNRRIRKR